MTCAEQVLHLHACTALSTILFFSYRARAHPPNHPPTKSVLLVERITMIIVRRSLAVLCCIAYGYCTLSPILLPFMFLVLAVEG